MRSSLSKNMDLFINYHNFFISNYNTFLEFTLLRQFIMSITIESEDELFR
jgi:hypothetical protein